METFIQAPPVSRIFRRTGKLLTELDNYLQRIEDLHKQVIEVLADQPSDALNWQPVVTSAMQVTNSMAAIAAHIAGAEHYWIGEVIGKAPPTRDRASEFATRVRNSKDLILNLNKVLEETRQVLASLSATDLDQIRMVEGREVYVRWAILHIIDHTALHLGHMQITYQVWAKGDSISSPFWFSRLPPR